MLSAQLFSADNTEFTEDLGGGSVPAAHHLNLRVASARARLRSDSVQVNRLGELELKVAREVDSIHGDVKLSLSMIFGLGARANNVVGQSLTVRVVVKSTKRDTFHSGFSVDHLIADSESTFEVRKLVHSIVVIQIPVEVCLYEQGHRDVFGHVILTQLLERDFAHVINLDMVLCEAALVHTGLNSEAIFAHGGAVRSDSQSCFRQTSREKSVLVDIGGSLNAGGLTLAVKVTLFLRAKLGLDLTSFGVDETKSAESQSGASSLGNEPRLHVQKERIEETVGNLIVSEILAVETDVNREHIGFGVLGNYHLDLRLREPLAFGVSCVVLVSKPNLDVRTVTTGADKVLSSDNSRDILLTFDGSKVRANGCSLRSVEVQERVILAGRDDGLPVLFVE